MKLYANLHTVQKPRICHFDVSVDIFYTLASFSVKLISQSRIITRSCLQRFIPSLRRTTPWTLLSQYLRIFLAKSMRVAVKYHCHMRYLMKLSVIGSGGWGRRVIPKFCNLCGVHLVYGHKNRQQLQKELGTVERISPYQ